jgi:hypothetical protein
VSFESVDGTKTRRLSKPIRVHRWDLAARGLFGLGNRIWAQLTIAAIAVGFVIVGADALDLGPAEARLGLASREHFGPLGQVVGYWAADLWPAQVLLGKVMSLLQPPYESSSGAVRWPAAIAGLIAGFLLIKSMARAQGNRAAVILGFCWFGTIALVDRSAGAGVDLMVALGTIAAIHRLMTRGPDLLAGLWAAWAFLTGGWPPLAVIGMSAVVLANRSGGFSGRLIVPPLLAFVAWSVWAIRMCSAEAWAAALTLPFTQKPSWTLAAGTLALGLPWSPFATLAASTGVRSHWKPECRTLVVGWIQVAAVALIAGTLIPGLVSAARMTALAGLAVGAAASLESAWCQTLSRGSRTWFFTLFALLTLLWLSIAIYGSFIWCVAMAYYRVLGMITGIFAFTIGFLAWSALAASNTRRGVVTVCVVAIAFKLAHWMYYVPEWNYRFSQGPWARAIAQWVPRRWTLYTIHEWPPDLAFYMKRPVRQLRSPRFLEYQPGPDSKFVLLLSSELKNWPESALSITPVARFLDKYGDERVLARSPGEVPPPLGPYPFRISPTRISSTEPGQTNARE